LEYVVSLNADNKIEKYTLWADLKSVYGGTAKTGAIYH
jgi:hypothetical protein